MTRSSLTTSRALPVSLPLRVAVWLLDRPVLGQQNPVKRLAGRLLKHPARAGLVTAQSRLGQLLCQDCDSARDRRIGRQFLQQAARAGDRQARLVLRQLSDSNSVGSEALR